MVVQRAAFVFALIPFICFPQPQPGSPWPMFRHDAQHTGRSDVAVFTWDHPFGTVKPPKSIFETALGSDGTIYGCADRLYAYTPDLVPRWGAPAGAGAYSAPVVAADGTVYVGTRDGLLVAITPDGTPKWSFQTDGIVNSTPAIGLDGALYFGSTDGFFYCVGPDHQLRWMLPSFNVFEASPAIGPDGTVYEGGWDGYLYALTPDGKTQWAVSPSGHPVGSPALGPDGTIYAMAYGDGLYAFAPDGSTKWRVASAYGVVGDPSVGVDGTVYFLSAPTTGSVYPNLTAVAPDTGAALWQVQTYGYDVDPPAIGADGTVYCGYEAVSNTGQWLYESELAIGETTLALDGTLIGLEYGYYGNPEQLMVSKHAGHERWRRSFPDRALQPVSAPDGTTYGASPFSPLVALDPTGGERWEVQLDGEIKQLAVGPDGSVFAATRIGSNGMGHIYAYSPEGTQKWRYDAPTHFSAVAVAPDGTVLGSPPSQDFGPLTALSPEGKVIWQYTGNFSYRGLVGGPDGSAYTSNGAGVVRAIGRDGNLKWSFINGSQNYSPYPAVGADGTVYIATERGFYVFRPDGYLKWERLDITAVLAPAVAADGTVYTAVGADLYALDDQGNTKWDLTVPGYPGSPVIGPYGLIYLVSDAYLLVTTPSAEVLCATPMGEDVQTPVVLPDGAAVGAEQKDLFCTVPWTRAVSGAIAFENSLTSPPVVPFDLRTVGAVAPFASALAAVGPTGDYSIRAPAQVLDLALKPSHWLRRTYHSLDCTAGNATGVNFDVINGDANGDNRVSIPDLSTILLLFGTTDQVADLDGSGKVGIADISIVLLNFNRAGDE